jgi:hypothetical protein
MPSLTRIVTWGHELVREVLSPGDLAVDLTAGKGRDTLALREAVGPTGQVVAFDTQAAALSQTFALLDQHGYMAQNWPKERDIPPGNGIFLVQGCHSTLQKLLTRPVRAVIANLGYLPGGDLEQITRPQSTLAALEQSLELLSVGGRLAVTVYPTHPGGMAEARRVDDFFTKLSPDLWQVLLLRVVNRSAAPYLLVAERRC